MPQCYCVANFLPVTQMCSVTRWPGSRLGLWEYQMSAAARGTQLPSNVITGAGVSLLCRPGNSDLGSHWLERQWPGLSLAGAQTIILFSYEAWGRELLLSVRGIFFVSKVFLSWGSTDKETHICMIYKFDFIKVKLIKRYDSRWGGHFIFWANNNVQHDKSQYYSKYVTFKCMLRFPHIQLTWQFDIYTKHLYLLVVVQS